jgi:hypothetical protein
MRDCRFGLMVGEILLSLSPHRHDKHLIIRRQFIAGQKTPDVGTVAPPDQNAEQTPEDSMPDGMKETPEEQGQGKRHGQIDQAHQPLELHCKKPDDNPADEEERSQPDKDIGESRGNPLATLEAQEYRPDVTEDGSERNRECLPGEGEKSTRQEGRNKDLEKIEEAHQRAPTCAQVAADVRAADVPAAYRADIHSAGFGDEIPHGDGAKQVSSDY